MSESISVSILRGKVALEAVIGSKTVNEIGQAHGVHPTQVGLWKKELQTQAASLFEVKRGVKPVDEASSPERLCAEIGRLKMELDWLKKSLGFAHSGAQNVGESR